MIRPAPQTDRPAEAAPSPPPSLRPRLAHRFVTDLSVDQPPLSQQPRSRAKPPRSPRLSLAQSLSAPPATPTARRAEPLYSLATRPSRAASPALPVRRTGEAIPRETPVSAQ
jgi:hypothetical protein